MSSMNKLNWESQHMKNIEAMRIKLDNMYAFRDDVEEKIYEQEQELAAAVEQTYEDAEADHRRQVAKDEF